MTDDRFHGEPQCRAPRCKDRQEFPDGPSEFCLPHAAGLWAYWRPLAEFGPIAEASEA